MMHMNIMNMGFMGLWMFIWILVAVLLMVGLVVILLHVSLRTQERDKIISTKEIRHPLINFLKDDERKVINYIIKSGGEVLQRDIVRATKLTKVKVHRILQRLEERGVIRLEKRGRTNLVKINKKFIELD